MTTRILVHQNQNVTSLLRAQQVEISSNKIFRQLANLISNHPFLKTQAINKEFTGSKIIQNQNSIKPKAFSKVVTWMKKLCYETLQFSNETLEISVKILKEYLEKSSQSCNTLQMLGCISLHLASKVNEKCIVAVQSYMECCLNIFTKEEFEAKEAVVFEKINYQIPSFTFFNALNFLNYEITNQSILTETQINNVETILEGLIIRLDFLDADPLSIVCNLFAQIHCNPGEININMEEFLTTLETRRIYF